MTKFSALQWRRFGSADLEKATAELPNGYSASVVRGGNGLCTDDGLFEIAVMFQGRIIYNTPITDDVLRLATEEEVESALERIATLPERDMRGVAQ